MQQILQLSGHAAGESRVDPRVGAGVQAGQQHQDGEGDPCAHTHTHAQAVRFLYAQLVSYSIPSIPPTADDSAARIVLFSPTKQMQACSTATAV